MNRMGISSFTFLLHDSFSDQVNGKQYVINVYRFAVPNVVTVNNAQGVTKL